MVALFYTDTERIPAAGEFAVLDGPVGHHAATVRRLRPGETIALSDGRGLLAHGQVIGGGRDRLDIAVHSRTRVPAPRPAVTVIQALPKSDRSELAVDLMTEAGVDVIVPWQAARCVAQWSGKAAKGVAKWRATAQAAAGQARRAHIPTVADLHSTDQVVERVRAAGPPAVAVVLHESADESFASLDWAAAESIMLVVGPEGSLTGTELDTLRAAGARVVRMGPTVVRTATAATVALGALGVLTSRWDMADSGIR